MADLRLAALTPFDLVRFLMGQPEAIVDFAQAPAALVVGAMFVLSAGLAREYDGEDLRAEPQHLLIPFVASLVTSLLLFTGVYAALRAHGGLVSGYWSLYARFLAVYWMTAPLAWLYALPVERWFSAAGAVKANLWLLAVVSAWRVVLMIRIVMVLFGASIEGAFSLVMAFAATVTAVTAWTLPMPIISVMGGIRLSEKDALIFKVMAWIRGLSTLGAPVLWLIAWLCIESPIQRWYELLKPSPVNSVHLSLWSMALASVCIWFWLARGPQREQRLRRQVEMEFRSGQIDQALEIMSSHKQTDFPPHWDPPRRPAYQLLKPRTVEVLDAIARRGAASWVIDVYHRKLGLEYATLYADLQDFVMFGMNPLSGDLTWDEAERLVGLFEQSAAARAAAVETSASEWLVEFKREEFDERYNDPDEAARRFAMYQRLQAVLRNGRPTST